MRARLWMGLWNRVVLNSSILCLHLQDLYAVAQGRSVGISSACRTRLVSNFLEIEVNPLLVIYILSAYYVHRMRCNTTDYVLRTSVDPKLRFVRGESSSSGPSSAAYERNTMSKTESKVASDQ